MVLQDEAGAVMDGQSFVAVEGDDDFAASGMGLAEKKVRSRSPVTEAHYG